MPNTATPQTDPDGQALMKVLTDLGATPGDAYNATQGVRNMAGQNVTARLEAKIETLGVELRTEIGQLATKFDSLAGTVEGLAPASQVDALSVQVQSHGVQLQSLTLQTELMANQLQSLVSQVEPLVSPTNGLAVQIAALTAQIQGQAAQTDSTNLMMTLLVVLLGTMASMGFFRWFGDWRRTRRLAEAGDSNAQPGS